MSAAQRPASRMKRVLFWVGGVLLGLVSLVVLVALMVVVALNTGWGRHQLVERVNAMLEGSFKGSVQLQRIGWVGLGGIHDVDAVARDPEGRTVIQLRGGDVEVALLPLGWQLVFASSDVLRIVISSVHVDDARVHLVDSGEGTPSLANTFAAAKASPPSSTSTEISLESIELSHAWVHGKLQGQLLDAEVDGLHGQLAVTSTATHLELERTRLALRGLPARPNPQGTLSGSLEIPLGDGALSASANFEGQVWEIPARLRTKLEGETIEADLKAPSISQAELRQLVPGISLRAPLALSVHGGGTLSRPEVSLRIQLEHSSLEVSAKADTRARTLELSARSHSLDLAVLGPKMPESALDLQLTADGSYTNDGQVKGRYDVALPAANRLNGLVLPRAKLEGTLRRGAEGELLASGKLHIDEPGAPSDIDYRVSFADGASEVRAVISSELSEPPRLSARVPGLGVTGHMAGNVRLALGTQRIRADASAHLANVSAPAFQASAVRLEASARGSLEAPQLDLRATFGALTLQGRTYRDGTLHASGTPQRLAVTASSESPVELAFSAIVSLEPELAVIHPDLRMTANDSSLRLSGGSLHVGGGRIVADDLTLEDPDGGVAHVSVNYDGGLSSLDFDAQKFDLEKALKPLALKGELPSALVTAKAHYERTAQGGDGTFEGSVDDLGYGSVKGISTEIDAELSRGALDGSLDTTWKDSRLKMRFNSVALSELPPARPEQFVGNLRAQADLNLSDFEPMLDAAQVPLSTLQGDANVDLDLRAPRGEPAWLGLSLETNGLGLAGEERRPDAPDSERGAELTEPWSLSQMDFDVELAFDEALRQLGLSATVEDQAGALARTRANVRWPRRAAQLALTQWPSLWREVEVDADAWLLPRKLSELPPMLRVSDVDGVASTSVEFRGSYESPEIRWMGRVERFGSVTDKDRDLDVMLSGNYAKDSGQVRLGAEVRSHQVVSVRGRWEGDLIAYLTAQGRTPRLMVQGDLDRLPVAALPFAARRFAGHLSGSLEYQGLREPVFAKTELHSEDLSIDELGIDQTRLQAELDDGQLRSELRLSGKEVGTLVGSLSRRSGLTDIEDLSDVQARLRTDDFRLRALRPFVSGSVSGLDGKLSVDMTGRLSARDPQLKGHIEVSEAALQLPALGQMLHNIDASVDVRPNHIDLSRLRAEGLTGAVTVKGEARLDGLALQTANAKVEIDRDEKLPLTLEGVSLGDAWGRAALAYDARGKRRQRLDVDVDEFHLDLPEVSPEGVQSLDPAEYVDVGFVSPAGKFVEIPLQPVKREDNSQPMRWLIAIDLGRVEIQKGPGVQIGLTGNLKVFAGRKARLKGRIDLTGGTLDVSGKEFTIERGSVTFDRGEVSDGVVVASARWESPLEYTVYAEYAGTIQNGELTLRSEPPLTQDEILSLLMFGTPTGTFGAGQANEAATAIGLAGGTVARGLNRALANISHLDVSTRVDTSTGEARPELVVQVTPRVTARVTQAIGEPAPGQSPDRTFLTLDFRLFRRWSLSAQVGDEGGSTLDLIWRRRY